MGIPKNKIPPEILARMEEAERRYYESGGLITHEQYKADTPWVDRKLAGRINKLERESQGEFANWLNLNGWKDGYIWHGTHKASTCHAGVPDFVLPVAGTTLYIEFKSPGGTLSLPQKNFALVLEQHQNKLHVVYTASEAIELVKATNKKGT